MRFRRFLVEVVCVSYSDSLVQATLASGYQLYNDEPIFAFERRADGSEVITAIGRAARDVKGASTRIVNALVAPLSSDDGSDISFRMMMHVLNEAMGSFAPSFDVVFAPAGLLEGAVSQSHKRAHAVVGEASLASRVYLWTGSAPSQSELKTRSFEDSPRCVRCHVVA